MLLKHELCEDFQPAHIGSTIDLKTSSHCWFLHMFSIIRVLLTRWNRKEMNAHSIRHDGLRLKKCINLTAKHNWTIKCSKFAQNYISGDKYQLFSWNLHLVFYSFCCQILWIMALDILLWDPVDLVHWTCTLFLKSCRSGIFKVCSVVRSWRSWILGILDPKFLLHCGILETLDLGFCIWSGILEILDLNFLFCHEILWILNPD